MARGFLKLCGAALIFGAGWKAKEIKDEMFSVPKPAANILAKLSQFWDGDDGGATEKKKKPRAVRQAEESLRREGDRIKTELRREMREGQMQIIAALTEEMKRSRDGARPAAEEMQRGGGGGTNSSPPPPARLL